MSKLKENTRKQINDIGKIINVRADGNCGLYAVTMGLVNLDIEVLMNVNDFRTKIYDYITDNKHKFIPSTLGICGYLNKKTYQYCVKCSQ